MVYGTGHMVVHATFAETGTTADCSYADIQQALNNGVHVSCHLSGLEVGAVAVCQLSVYGSGMIVFNQTTVQDESKVAQNMVIFTPEGIQVSAVFSH